MAMIKAIIFDMDGTLVDSIPFHKDAWLLFLKKHGIILAPEELEDFLVRILKRIKSKSWDRKRNALTGLCIKVI